MDGTRDHCVETHQIVKNKCHMISVMWNIKMLTMDTVRRPIVFRGWEKDRGGKGES
jgi:hypothetical protein